MTSVFGIHSNIEKFGIIGAEQFFIYKQSSKTNRGTVIERQAEESRTERIIRIDFFIESGDMSWIVQLEMPSHFDFAHEVEENIELFFIQRFYHIGTLS